MERRIERTSDVIVPADVVIDMLMFGELVRVKLPAAQGTREYSKQRKRSKMRTVGDLEDAKLVDHGERRRVRQARVRANVHVHDHGIAAVE